ncbi:MAG: TetR/AcrR family transcriptional regulator [Anaerolineae bacterium]|nr:MAG: TetR/AcrR family transcriptional regulator [Anaerolineae bacterium]
MTTPALDRHEQRKLETRQRLLDAAEEVFSRMGYEAASVLDITEAANVSKRTFYLHFNDKEELIEALAMRGFIELRTQAENKEDLTGADHTFEKGMHSVAKLIFEYVQDHPQLMEIVFGRDGSFRLQAMAREFIAQAWEENIARECTWKADADAPSVIVANAMAGMLFQLMCWWSQHPNEYTPDEMAKMYASMLIKGIEVNFIHHNHMQNP